MKITDEKITDKWLEEVADDDDFDFECPKCGGWCFTTSGRDKEGRSTIYCKGYGDDNSTCKWQAPRSPDEVCFVPSKAALAAEIIWLRNELGYLGKK